MAAKIPLFVPKNAKFSHRYTCKIDGVLINFTGYTAKGQVRDSRGNLLLEFAITLGGAAGTIDITSTLALNAAVTANQGVYDIIVKNGSADPDVLIEGPVTFIKGSSTF